MKTFLFCANLQSFCTHSNNSKLYVRPKKVSILHKNSRLTFVLEFYARSPNIPTTKLLYLKIMHLLSNNIEIHHILTFIKKIGPLCFKKSIKLHISKWCLGFCEFNKYEHILAKPHFKKCETTLSCIKLIHINTLAHSFTPLRTYVRF